MMPRQAGFSYVELLIATLLLVSALVPMMEALGPGLQGARVHADRAEAHFFLAGKLEATLAESFDDLDAAAIAAGSATTPTGYSDLAADVPHEVFIWRWDADNADADDDPLTGGEDDLLWLRVAATDGTLDLQTLVSRY